MTTELTVFKEQEVLGKEFKIYGDIDNMYFLAKDIALWIEHNKPNEMINNVDEQEKLKAIVWYSGQCRHMWFITLSGLKQILVNSRKILAKDLLKHIDNNFVMNYKIQPQQTKFTLLLRDAINIHLESNLDFDFCPYSGENYYTSYKDSLYFMEEYTIGKYRVDYYFPIPKLVIEYDEKFHDNRVAEDKEREIEIMSLLDRVDINFINDNGSEHKIVRVKEGMEHEGIIQIITHLMYSFVS